MKEEPLSGLRDAILGAEDLPEESVSTPEWADAGVAEVTVRGLSAFEREQYEKSLTERDSEGNVVTREDMPNIRAALVVRCVVDANGDRIFNDADIEALGRKSGLVVDRLWGVARKLSGMGQQAQADAEGNSVGPSAETSTA